MRKLSTLLVSGALIAAATIAPYSLPALAATPSAHDPAPMSVRHFVAYGWRLARRGATVIVSGVYARDGAVGMLYGSHRAVSLEEYSPVSEPHVAVLERHASPALRTLLMRCYQRDAVGCRIAVQGVAVPCVLSNEFGAQRQAVCIDAINGMRMATPPDVLAERHVAAMAAAEDRAQMRAEAQARRQRQRALELGEEQAAMAQAYRRCRRLERANLFDLFGAVNRCRGTELLKYEQ